MSGQELKSRLIARACVSAAEAAGHPAAMLRRGDPDGGVVYVKALARDGSATLYAQARAFDGPLGWRRVTGPTAEAEIDDRIARDANIDPDMWVVEVMDDAMAHPLDPPLLED